MALKHDAQGFLLGEPLDMGRAVNSIEAIQRDVAAIRVALTAGRPAAARDITGPGTTPAVATPRARNESAKNQGGKQETAATPRARDERGRFAKTEPAIAPAMRSNPAGTMAAATFPQSRQEIAGNSREASGNHLGDGDMPMAQPAAFPRQQSRGVAAAPRTQTERGRSAHADDAIAPPKRSTPATQRDAQGRRFAGPGQDEGGRARPPVGDGIIQSAASRIATAVGMIGGMEEADPNVKAMQEVAEPMKRSYEAIFGNRDDRRKEGWWRRIFGELRLFRVESSVFDKEATKRLKAIEGKPAGEIKGSDGLMGGLLGMMGGGKGLLGGLLGLGGGLLKGIGKRLPWIAAIGTLLGFAGDAEAADEDPNLTPAERRKRKFQSGGDAGGKIAGLLGGAKLGAMLGGMVAGPIGAAVGGFLGGAGGYMLGDTFGEKIGEWTQTLVDADIPGLIGEKWGAFTGWASEEWEKATASMGESWSAVTNTMSGWWESFTKAASASWEAITSTFKGVGDAFIQMMKDKFGVDLPAIGEKIKKAAAYGADAVQENAGLVNKWVKDKTGVDVAGGIRTGIDRAGSAAESVKNRVADAAKIGMDAAPKLLKSAKSGLSRAYDKAVDFTSRNAVEPVAGSVSDLIHMGESKRRGYNDYNRGSDKWSASNKANIDLEGMTIGEIMDKQALPRGDKDRLFAVGKYQAIPATLKGAVKALGLDTQQKFTPEVQERIFSEYLATGKKGRGSLENYVKTGKGSADEAVHAIAQEWASVESPKLGRGVYDGVGTNSAHIKSKSMLPAVEAARQKYAQLREQGIGEKEAYATALGAATASTPAQMEASARMPPDTSAKPSELPATAAPSAAVPQWKLLPVTASMPDTVASPTPGLPKIPAIHQYPPIADAPQAQMPINLGGSRQIVVASTPPADAGQDLTDRNIAHIVTGGYSQRL